MPPTKSIIGGLVFIAAIILIAEGIGWVVTHPIVPLIIVAAVAAGVVYLVRRKRQRNLV